MQLLLLRRLRVSYNDREMVIEPGGTVTFSLPFHDYMSDESTKVRINGTVDMRLNWDGKVLRYVGPPQA
jgi:hypothetical protein